MSLSDTFLQRVTHLLSTSVGTRVRLVKTEPITEGWSAQFGMTSPWPWVARCTIAAETALLPASVIVKARHPAKHFRSESERFHNEAVALDFLTRIESEACPRLLAASHEEGILILEDLGTGPALEDLLVGHDAWRAEQGLIAFATILGQMHATTIGHAASYYHVRNRFGLVDPAFDRVSILGIDIRGAFRRLQEITASRPYLPPSVGAEEDVDELLRLLAEPGPYLAFSNGDTSPANCRWSENGLRFLDFEHACFRHALLDVAALRFPFPGCPCWSHVPEEILQRALDAYKERMGRSCPEVLDPNRYSKGLTAACAAWTIVRATRLPKLEEIDEPQPMGFSRRGQLLDTISTTVTCSQQSRSLQSLAAWLTDVRQALRLRWPYLPLTQPVYPAFH
ncbi:hypothetical protein EPA93_06595 [Ktedonosporobacter rubrisoli]|uniref:Aminoglycoside phosphotransferase domain-containing protein n=1 Tax=Ktedonosporobacter rubrisoli TaxID=2509675 RepID=A0A4V0YYC0_KTERU|nr:phosphotransferase [Ktedonosporobacter rubrisoli]QBD75691.1 hypothetical protein EPA93_06595 [Ktedonosporobacter rubrisoli]